METVVCNWICGALPRAAQLLWGRLRNRMSCEITGTQARHWAHQTTSRNNLPGEKQITEVGDDSSQQTPP